MNLIEQYRYIQLKHKKNKLTLMSNKLYEVLSYNNNFENESEVIYSPDYSYELSKKILKLQNKINILQKRN